MLLLFRIDGYDTDIADKTLRLVTHLANVHSDLLSTKPRSKLASVKRPSVLVRIADEADSGVQGDTGSDVVDSNASSRMLKFFSKFQSYLESVNSTLKCQLLHHSRRLALQLSMSLQRELFIKVLIPAFQSHFSGAGSNFSVSCEMSDIEIKVLKEHLEALLAFMRHDEFMWSFHQFDGVAMLDALIKSKDISLALAALALLEYLAWFKGGIKSCNHENKTAKGVKVDASKKDFLTVSRDALRTILRLLQQFLLNSLKVGPDIFIKPEGELLYGLLQIVLNLLPDNNFFQELFTSMGLFSKCTDLFDCLVLHVEQLVVRQHRSETPADTSFVHTIHRMLPWLNVLLPLCLRSTSSKGKVSQEYDEFALSFLTLLGMLPSNIW